MGRIKIFWIMALAVIVNTACERESIDLHEDSVNSTVDLTFVEFLNSGVDVEKYLEKISLNERENIGFNKSQSGFSDATAAYFEEFCDNLPVENFEEANIDPLSGSEFFGPLSENGSRTTRIKASDIESGLLITTDNIAPILAIFGDGLRGGNTKLIVGKTDQALILQFSGEDVISLGLDISSFPYPEVENSQQVTVAVRYTTGETYVETITATAGGTFWGITGDSMIQQLTISSTNQDAWVGVDNIAFGTCRVPDSDGDGCVDSDDPNDNSNLEASIIIGGCDSGVPNRSTAVCGISLADDVDSFEEGTYRNHGALVKEFATLTNLWVSQGLITSEEKGLLMSCAAKAGF